VGDITATLLTPDITPPPQPPAAGPDRRIAAGVPIYYAALRPEEAVNLRRDNIALPPLVQDESTLTIS
jgi:hypothetical protein